MYKKVLVSELIDEGQRLLETLRRNRFPITSALWHYIPDSLEWRLVIVSSAVEHSGPMAAYGRVQRALGSIDVLRVALSDIVLIGPNSQEYQALRQVVGAPGRFSGTVPLAPPLHNVVFEDDYVYRV